ncbi:8876_t:CDS:2, partial [Acaulospora morrowiae]
QSVPTKSKPPYWTNLSDVAKWKPEDEFNVAKVNLKERPVFRTEGVSQDKVDKRECKVVVCHDMAGGYIENFFNIGYSIQYWQYVDVFIYFSHHRITVPPPQWTNAAHRNGVKILGTFITEWERDMLENELWVRGPHSGVPLYENTNVNREVVSVFFADKMVQMALYYNFDGWFINVESPLIGGTPHARQVIKFMEYLTQQMHKHKPGSVVLWYDSITKEGALSWQDQLNDMNYPFFEVTDGIFINYTWKEHYPSSSSKKAGPRKRSVFTGIDVWGRNTYGGGGLTTYKALQVIQKAKTSCALFAPAWTYEHFGKETFWEIDRKFWIGNADQKKEPIENNAKREDPSEGSIISRISEFRKNIAVLMNNLFADKGLAVAHYITPRYSAGIKNFYSNFDRGCGHNFFIKGKKVLEQEWYHLSHQSIQPYPTNPTLHILSSDDSLLSYRTSYGTTWEPTFDQAYTGGTSILIKGTDKGKDFSMIPLFDLNVVISPQKYTRASITYMPKDQDVMIGLYVKVGLDRKRKDSTPDDEKIKINFSGTTSQNQQDFSIVTLEEEDEEGVRTTGDEASARYQKFETTFVSVENDWITAEVQIPPNTFSLSTADPSIEISIQELGVVIVRQPFPENIKEELPIPETEAGLSSILLVGELSISSPPQYLFDQEIQNVFWNEHNLRIENLEIKGLLRVSGTVEWELGVQITNNRHEGLDENSSSDVDIVNSFGYYYVYAAIHSSQKKEPNTEELTFLGVADVNMFVVAGYDVPVSQVEKDTVLSIWIQGVKEIDGKCEELEKWKRCEISLASVVEILAH